MPTLKQNIAYKNETKKRFGLLATVIRRENDRNILNKFQGVFNGKT